MKKFVLTILISIVSIWNLNAQDALVNTHRSPYAKLWGAGWSNIKFTEGFWRDRFEILNKVMIPSIWNIYTSDTVCYAFQNFKIAAGLEKGAFRGPSFHDGDFYKTLEALAAAYAVTKNEQLDKWMDEAIAVIEKAQRPDGYIYTKNIIEQKTSGVVKMFDDRLSFEAYNFGHLMTAACVHYRATGKKSLLNIAVKAADFLIEFYDKATPEQARNAICPSHYMGLAELYRTTQYSKYLSLLQKLIDIRGTTDGTDDNSDRAPFREMQRIVGHAVRANYLMAGVADLYAENGDETLKTTLDRLWNNIVHTKMYVTGGCGALYDGVSVDGISYNPDTVQRVHQAYGRDYQLPNLTAHNETCANIGNVLWNYRMFLLSGEERYMNIVELALYNSVLSGVSLDGTGYFYTNPLAHNKTFPYILRWSGGRVPYIHISNCCPPNLVRTLAEVGEYMYSVSREGFYINTYSSNNADITLADGSKVSLKQQTDYPWDGNVNIVFTKTPDKSFNVYLRIPNWCENARIYWDGKEEVVKGGQYFALNKKWKQGDKIALELDMPVTLLASHPLVEETRNQVAVKRGPIVYCIESADASEHSVFNVMMPVDANLKPVPTYIANTRIMALEAQLPVLKADHWEGILYNEVPKTVDTAQIKLIPYFTWANRGLSDMSVWMPIFR